MAAKAPSIASSHNNGSSRKKGLVGKGLLLVQTSLLLEKKLVPRNHIANVPSYIPLARTRSYAQFLKPLV